MKINRSPLALGLMTFLLASVTGYGQLITNGDFESWGTVSGTPPTGVPTSWAATAGAYPLINPIQGDGLVAGSTYSAIIQAGKFNVNNSGLTQVVTAPADFTLSLVMASAAVSGTGTTNSNRSFNLSVYQGGTQALNLRLSNTSATSGSGFLSLQAHNGSAWVTLLDDAFAVSVFDSAGSGFDLLNAYNLSITTSFTDITPSYSISYGLVGSSLTTVSGFTSFFQTPTTGDVTRITLAGTNSTSNYAVDNMVLSAAVPEPAVASMLMGGLGLLVAMRRRSRKTASTLGS